MHRCDWIPVSVRQETPSDDDKVRILGRRAAVRRTAGTRLGRTRASRGLVDVKPREQIICHPRFEREIKLVRM